MKGTEISKGVVEMDQCSIFTFDCYEALNLISRILENIHWQICPQYIRILKKGRNDALILYYSAAWVREMAFSYLSHRPQPLKAEVIGPEIARALSWSVLTKEERDDLTNCFSMLSLSLSPQIHLANALDLKLSLHVTKHNMHVFGSTQ